MQGLRVSANHVFLLIDCQSIHWEKMFFQKLRLGNAGFTKFEQIEGIWSKSANTCLYKTYNLVVPERNDRCIGDHDLVGLPVEFVTKGVVFFLDGSLK